MTTMELRTSIAAELDQMSVEMLENVSHYVKRLRQRPKEANNRSETVKDRRDAAMQFVKKLSVYGGQPVPSDERGINALISEKY